VRRLLREWGNRKTETFLQCQRAGRRQVTTLVTCKRRGINHPLEMPEGVELEHKRGGYITLLEKMGAVTKRGEGERDCDFLRRGQGQAMVKARGH